MSPEKVALKEVAETISAHQTARSEPIQQEELSPPTMDFIRSLVLGIPVQSYRPESSQMNIEKMLEAQLEAEVRKSERISDPTDVITMDVPLLIRLLEYAREDAKTDMDLHNVAENLIKYSKIHDVLSMEQYDKIVAAAHGGNEDPSAPAFAGEPQNESLESLKKLAGIR